MGAGVVQGLPTLSLNDYDSLLGDFYNSAIDEHSWSDCLARLRDIYQANFVTLILRAPRHRDHGVMLVLGAEDSEAGLNFDYPGLPTPLISPEANQVFTVTDLMSEDAWIDSRYYREFCKPRSIHHVLGVDILPPGSGVYRFRITRPSSQADFSAAEKTFCSRLISHFMRVLHIRNLLTRNESLNTLYSQAAGRLAVATLVLDERGRLIETNSLGRDLLAAADGLRLVDGRVTATYSGDNKRLYEALNSILCAMRSGSAAGTGALSIARSSGQPCLGLVLESVASEEWANGENQPAIAVYVRDVSGAPMINADRVQQILGLTRTEASVAMELANGASLEETANSLGIQRSTARAHLRAVFSKTGTRRQTELVRIILNSVIGLAASEQKSARLDRSARINL